MSAGGIERIESLVGSIESAPESATRAIALELIQSVLAVHGEGFQRILAVLNNHGEAGRELTRALLEEELVSSLLSLHGLHPDTLQWRVERALVKLGDRLASQGSKVTLREVAEEGVVTVRLYNASPAIADRLRSAVEEAILSAAPDATQVIFEQEPGQDFVPLTSLTSSHAG